ncbi:hypothetical protein POF63_04755 [Streptococcus agalactiae]|uniref:hypothetical protein n=1 Tax=Streptococcus agalactiae TaxID=1311 RepID=UPI0002BA562F|nr:hypothetical protein [Streptococcus agalactiae]AIX04655.1 hypothetical protein W903_0967 [Streptococcus agalactiae CNCTC 10/84]EPT54795.1 hypothetical protein SAG0053_01375 [Streptococcus agalactiae CCUG 25532]EPT85266.1 hypothetical protein SAG0099_01165 [Streptococcus agalactiae BSU247]EPV19277.1 hypothetical protein SAG0334_01160 [Streptococcus agalactiae GB00640]EPW99114.1 hypothetical protein SAG0147_04345 [Streptococcus agalactiae MRI Z1-048]
MKKTLLLSAAALMLVSAGIATSNSVSANTYARTSYYKNDSRYLRQNGKEALREAKNSAELRIRNLLQQHHITGDNYYGYFNNYYNRKAKIARTTAEVEQAITDLKQDLESRQVDEY